MPDSLTAYLSGDAYLGDAQAVISINGALSGVLDVAAVHAADATQAFTFTGDFGANPQVSVSFLNDAYGGPGLDRNLYLDGFSYDGVSQLGIKYGLGYDQTDTYALTSTSVPAQRAAGFTDSIGAVVNLTFSDTPEGSVQNDLTALGYLGISHANGAIPSAQTLPAMLALAAAGIKFGVIMPAASSDTLLPVQLAAIDQLGSAITAIEGPNEVNLYGDFSWDGQSGDDAAIAYQKALFADVKADPDLANVPVYGFTLGGVGADSYQTLGSISPYETDGSMHVYFANGSPPYQTLQYVLGITGIDSPGRPVAITETNYVTAPLIAGAVDDAVQAKYDLDLLMDADKLGVPATYFYELIDPQPDPADANGQDHFGLFNNDGTPKPAAAAIHALNAILADAAPDAAAFSTGALAYTVTGLPASGDTLLLQKSNGTYDLVVWAEPEIWSDATGELAAAARQVQVSLGSTAAGISVFDPLAGATALAQYADTAAITVTVTDHPLVIQVTPFGLGVPPPTTLGQGPDTLALFLSEDAFQGDAQFTVAVDGAQIRRAGQLRRWAAPGQRHLPQRPVHARPRRPEPLRGRRNHQRRCRERVSPGLVQRRDQVLHGPDACLLTPAAAA